jgi:ABC-2 type transport system ATP-binding protein
VVILRAGHVVHTQLMSHLRRQHRIVATLDGPTPAIPPELSDQLAVVSRHGSEVEFQTPGELAPLLKWLATLPLADVRIEPVGLRTVYDRYHAEDGPPSSGFEGEPVPRQLATAAGG